MAFGVTSVDLLEDTSSIGQQHLRRQRTPEQEGAGEGGNAALSKNGQGKADGSAPCSRKRTW